MRLYLGTHVLGALWSIIAKHQRGNPVLEDKDPACRQTAKRRGAWSVAAGETKPQESAGGENSSRDSAKPTGVKSERNRQYDTNECLGCGMKDHKERDCTHTLRLDL